MARKDSSACVVVCSPVLACGKHGAAQPGMGRRKPCADTVGRMEAMDFAVSHKGGFSSLAIVKAKTAAILVADAVTGEPSSTS